MKRNEKGILFFYLLTFKNNFALKIYILSTLGTQIFMSKYQSPVERTRDPWRNGWV